MSIETKRLNQVLNAVLADAEIGARVVALAKEAVPGSAKHAALTKEQRRWLWNQLKNFYIRLLKPDKLLYYQSLPASAASIVVQAKPALLQALGVEELSAGSAASEPRVSGAPVKQPFLKDSRRRRLGKSERAGLSEYESQKFRRSTQRKP